jgi:3-methyladenine DNA glycosylase Mpg
MCHTYIYILLALCQNLLNIIFQAVSEVSGAAEAVLIRHVHLWPGHIRLARHVRLRAQTCSGLGFPAYIRGLGAP